MFTSSQTFKTPRARLGASALSLAAAFTLLATSVSLAQGMKDMGGMEKSMKPSDAKATGTVAAVNVTDHKITLDHGPIPAIKWPAMKMEFAVAPNVNLSKVKGGDKVDFALSGSGSFYTVESIVPAK